MLLLAAVVAVACGGGSSKTVKIPGGGEVSVSDKLPGSFPKDYPVYKGAKVTGSFSGSNSGVNGTAVTWETGDSLDKVKAFYSDAFQSGAWPTNSNGEINGSAYWAGESADGKKAFYTSITNANNKTTIVATVGDKSKDSSSDSSSSDNTPSSGSSKTSTSSGSSSKKTSTPSSDSSDSGSTPVPNTKLPAEVKISKDFPTDRVPFPSGARITSASSFGGGGSKTYSVEIYVKDTPENVGDFFANELPKHGWTSGFSSESNGEYVETFSKEGADSSSTEGVTISASEADVAGYTKADIIVSSTGG
jgi:hypothetical protein